MRRCCPHSSARMTISRSMRTICPKAMRSRRNSRPFRRGGSGRSATLPNSHHRKPGPAPGFCVFTEIRKMSDENPKPVIDLDTVFTEWTAYEARRAELHPANKASLFAALGAAGITRVVLTFNGGGDSGQTEKIEAFAGDDLRDLPDVTVELRDLLFREGEPRTLSQPHADAIDTLAYACPQDPKSVV